MGAAEAPSLPSCFPSPVSTPTQDPRKHSLADPFKLSLLLFLPVSPSHSDAVRVTCLIKMQAWCLEPKNNLPARNGTETMFASLCMKGSRRCLF